MMQFTYKLSMPAPISYYCKPWNFRKRFILAIFHECTVKRELKTHENFNSNALTIKFLQQTRNFVFR
jgi:hypothetical protein